MSKQVSYIVFEKHYEQGSRYPEDMAVEYKGRIIREKGDMVLIERRDGTRQWAEKKYVNKEWRYPNWVDKDAG